MSQTIIPPRKTTFDSRLKLYKAVPMEDRIFQIRDTRTDFPVAEIVEETGRLIILYPSFDTKEFNDLSELIKYVMKEYC